MGIQEWIEHYTWQGADVIVLLDNNSTDNGPRIAKQFSNVSVVHAPKNNAQVENYYLGLSEIIKHNVDFVAVVDLDEYMFGKKISLKQCVEYYDRLGVSQISVNWAMFGSSGFVQQPRSIRASFIRRKKELQTNLKSIWKCKDLIQLFTHKSHVRGKSIEDNSIIQLNHYIIQSREYFATVKMPRGDVCNSQWASARTWSYFNANDFDELDDTLLKDRLHNKVSVPLNSTVQSYWGIFEYNPTTFVSQIPYLPLGIIVVLWLILVCGGSRALTLWCSLHFLLLESHEYESQQIQENKLLGKLCFSFLTLASLVL